MPNIMVDIEALGLRAGAAIIELAAVVFDIESGNSTEEFHCRIKPAAPFLCDYETIGWHAKQGTAIDHPDAISPSAAVLLFVDWLDRVAPVMDERTFWSWGSDYDFPLLIPLLDSLPDGKGRPWEYFQTRCARTVWRVAFGRMKPAPRPHAALDDVKAAIGDLALAMKELKRAHAG